MLGALNRVGTDPHAVATSILWRLVDGRGGVWIQPAARAAEAIIAMRAAEERQIAAGVLPAVGFLASIPTLKGVSATNSAGFEYVPPPAECDAS